MTKKEDRYAKGSKERYAKDRINDSHDPNKTSTKMSDKTMESLMDQSMHMKLDSDGYFKDGYIAKKKGDSKFFPVKTKGK